MLSPFDFAQGWLREASGLSKRSQPRVKRDVRWPSRRGEIRFRWELAPSVVEGMTIIIRRATGHYAALVRPDRAGRSV